MPEEKIASAMVSYEALQKERYGAIGRSITQMLEYPEVLEAIAANKQIRVATTTFTLFNNSLHLEVEVFANDVDNVTYCHY